jgi:hypothetical protein
MAVFWENFGPYFRLEKGQKTDGKQNQPKGNPHWAGRSEIVD